MNRPYFLTPGYKSEIEETRQGVYRVTVPANQTDQPDDPQTNTITTLSVSGRKIIFPRSENLLDMVLAVWPGNIGTTNQPILIERGGVFQNPFKENVIRVGFFLKNSNYISWTPTTSLVLYVCDKLDSFVEPASEEILTAERCPASGYFANSDATVGQVIDLTGSRGGSLYSAPPTATDANSGGGFRLERVSSITFAVLDATAVSSAGTILRPWWYFPSLLTAVNSNVVGAGDGWVPDGTTYTVGATDRIFTMQINVRLGYSPTWLRRSSDGSSIGETVKSVRYRDMSGALLTFQATAIPGVSQPRLIVTGEVMP